MALVANPNLRLVDQDPLEGDDIAIEIAEDGPKQDIDEHGNIMSIELPDGSITFSLDGSPIEKSESARKASWFDNLVDEIDAAELSMIAHNLMKGVQDDLDSRKECIEDRAQGIKLLGLKI